MRTTLADGSYWVYQYDKLGQVTSGKRYWSDGTPVAGQQFEYGFDDIGNRLSTKAGGDSGGAALRAAAYTNNTLNQILGRDVPGYLNIIGAATTSATNVNVNNVLAYRKGEYYRVELNPDNSANPVWQSVTNRAVQNGATNSVAGSIFLPKTAETFAYDADGNLTNDGRWMLTWDGENRLIKIESQSSAPTASKRRVEFTYDFLGRMIRRTEYNGSSGSYVITNDLKFICEGWHCVAELNATNNALVRSYLWGLDLSGTLAGAGGIGGILAINSVANGVHFYAYDGNGNVTTLIKGSDGAFSANYEYDPFGQTIRATGAIAQENPYRFSTKRNDDATALVHYEFRVYRPSTGTWLSRDPSGEESGANLFGYCVNATPGTIDVLGLCAAGCDVESFTITDRRWIGGWPSLTLFGKRYSKQLRVNFKLVLKAGSDKKYCAIRQDRRGRTKTNLTPGGLFDDWTSDGGNWWGGSSWSAGGGSWSSDGLTATFKDEPGFNNLTRLSP